MGVESSLQESKIFEDTYDVDSISTIKGLGIANDDPSMTVHKINSSNVGLIDTLNLSESTKDILRGAVNGGQTIYTPDQRITYYNWTGLVYITLNATTGEAIEFKPLPDFAIEIIQDGGLLKHIKKAM